LLAGKQGIRLKSDAVHERPLEIRGADSRLLRAEETSGAQKARGALPGAMPGDEMEDVVTAKRWFQL
jgi:hypothetical protein